MITETSARMRRRLPLFYGSKDDRSKAQAARAPSSQRSINAMMPLLAPLSEEQRKQV